MSLDDEVRKKIVLYETEDLFEFLSVRHQVAKDPERSFLEHLAKKGDQLIEACVKQYGTREVMSEFFAGARKVLMAQSRSRTGLAQIASYELEILDWQFSDENPTTRIVKNAKITARKKGIALFSKEDFYEVIRQVFPNREDYVAANEALDKKMSEFHARYAELFGYGENVEWSAARRQEYTQMGLFLKRCFDYTTTKVYGK